MFEAWLVTAAWAQATERIRIGLMVGANTFRNPALVAKMATTLDHLSNGRAILGIGAAWFGEEHEAFGLEFGPGPPERLRWLAEALPVIRGMLDGTEPSAAGPHYAAEERAERLPAPVQCASPDLHRRRRRAGRRLKTRRPLRRHEQRRRRRRERPAQRRRSSVRHCEAVGARSVDDRADVTGVGTVFIRDDRADADGRSGRVTAGAAR